MAKLIDITGRALSGEWGSDDDVGTGIPVLRTTNFTNEGTINYNKVVTRKITKRNIEEKYLRSGDIIIEKSGGSDKLPVGRVVFYEGPKATYMFNNFTGVLRIRNPEQWSSQYVFYALYYNYKKGGTRSFENRTTGLHNLKIDNFVNCFEIKDIALRSQVDICNKLNAIKKIIAQRKEQLFKINLLVQGRFVEMFGDPVSNPFGWDKRSLSKMILNANNGMARRGNDINGNIVLRLVELQQGYINYSAPNRIILNDKEKEKYCLKENDFLFARVNGNPENVGRCAVFHEIDEPIYHNDHIIRVHFDEDKLNGVFVSTLLNSEYGEQQMHAQIKTSAGQYTISQEGIGAIEMILPPISLQERFADLVAQIDKSKVVIQKSIDKLQLLFDSLMQQYFG